MQQGGGGGGGGDDKNSAHMLWVIALIFGIGAIIWWQFAPQLKQFFLWVRVAELQAIVFLVQPFNPDAEVVEALFFAQDLTIFNLSADAAKYLSRVTGDYLRYPISGFFLFAIYMVYSRHIKLRFQKIYSTKTLRHQEQKIWSQITPVAKLDLVNTELSEGPWAMARTPTQFAKTYQLLEISVAIKDPDILSPGDSFIAKVITSKANRVFAAQLGNLWNNPAQMPLYQQALFAVFIARGSRDTKSASDLLKQISKSLLKSSQPDFSGAKKLWKKHYKTRKVQDLCAKHAYVNSLMISALLFAREDGVLATADFIWLKPRDRKLWYVLNTVGRQTPVAEAAGTYAHWLAEKAIGKALTVPMIAEATIALKLAVAEIIYEPGEEEREQLLSQGAAN
ncbi:MAG: phosphoesterase [Legionellales bacterium]|nr:MAG: phosphoesterase [Legionellales bacterium]